MSDETKTPELPKELWLLWDLERGKWGERDGHYAAFVSREAAEAAVTIAHEAGKDHDYFTPVRVLPCLGRAPETPTAITPRDLFAAAALSQLVYLNTHGDKSHSSVANEAFRYADAMMAERERRKDKS